MDAPVTVTAIGGHGFLELFYLGSEDKLLRLEYLSDRRVDLVLDRAILGLEVEQGNVHMSCPGPFLKRA